MKEGVVFVILDVLVVYYYEINKGIGVYKVLVVYGVFLIDFYFYIFVGKGV